MSNSRRTFLRAGIMAALFAAAPIRNIFGQGWKDRDGNPANNPPSQSDPLANYSKATFQSYLNSVFELHTVTGIVGVTLLKVDNMPSAKDGECFSLLFRGGSRAFRQDTYTLVHPSLGTFQLFLVPVGTDQNGAQGYLATINRLSFTDALNSAAPTKQSGSMHPTSTPTPAPAATPATTATPAVTPAQPTAPATQAPGKNSKPARKRKPSWKNNDNEILDDDLNLGELT